jgi:hypothetical protein
MDSTAHIPFPHRNNPDGSWDAICPKCHRTIARARTEAALLRIELRHNCDELEWSGYRVPDGLDCT